MLHGDNPYGAWAVEAKREFVCQGVFQRPVREEFYVTQSKPIWSTGCRGKTRVCVASLFQRPVREEFSVTRYCVRVCGHV
jgi:hypothetical protein